VLTDIPFNVDLKYLGYDDKLPPEVYAKKCESWFSAFSLISKISIVKSPTKTMPIVLPAFDKCIGYLWTIIQYSPNATTHGPFNLSLYSQYLVGGKPYKRPNFDLFKNTGNKISSGHPAEMPIGPMAQLLLWFTNDNDLIAEPFLGSGTTAVACERLKRRWIGIEIEEKYCAIAVKRIEAERRQLKLF